MGTIRQKISVEVDIVMKKFSYDPCRGLNTTKLIAKNFLQCISKCTALHPGFLKVNQNNDVILNNSNVRPYSDITGAIGCLNYLFTGTRDPPQICNSIHLPLYQQHLLVDVYRCLRKIPLDINCITNHIAFADETRILPYLNKFYPVLFSGHFDNNLVTFIRLNPSKPVSII